MLDNILKQYSVHCDSSNNVHKSGEVGMITQSEKWLPTDCMAGVQLPAGVGIFLTVTTHTPASGFHPPQTDGYWW